MLNTTDKGSRLVPEYRRISKEWEKEVGISDKDEELKKRIAEIAYNGMRLVED